MAFSLRASSPVVVQDTDAGTTSSISLPNVVAGDGIIIGYTGWSSTPTITSCAISGETVEHIVTTASVDHRRALYYVAAAATGGTKTVDLTYSAEVTNLRCFAIAVEGGIVLDDFGSGTDSLSLDSTATDDFAVAISCSAWGVLSARSGYTLFGAYTPFNESAAQYHLGLGAPGAYDVSMTRATQSQVQATIGAIFKTAAGGSPKGRMMMLGIG